MAKFKLEYRTTLPFCIFQIEFYSVDFVIEVVCVGKIESLSGMAF